MAATTSTLGWFWKKNCAPNLHTPYPAMPTRTFLSLNGCQGPPTFSSVKTSSKPWIFDSGFCSAAFSPIAAVAATDPMKKSFRVICMSFTFLG